MPAARSAYTGRFSKSPVPIKERFLSFVLVNPVSKCWNWLGNVRGQYGRFSVGPQKTRINFGAHRWAYEYWRGPVPDGMWVLHTCDHTECVNPDHLFLGTHADNEADKDRKGRRPIGEKIVKTKLTDAQVREIFHDKRLHREIAADYGINKSHVSNIKRKHDRRHVWA